jgi:peptidoglycan/LPS O-acetylase OafA/YrhL
MPTANPGESSGSVSTRNAGLDGLRGLAIALIVAYHAAPKLVPGGWSGVDVFFPLSGFLITHQLYGEWRTTGSMRVGSFFRRRLRRLGPALGFFLALWLAVGVVANHVGSSRWFATVPNSTASAPHALGDMVKAIMATLTLRANWVIINDPPFSSIGHVWSLAVEEQFYLVWPLVLLVVWKLGRRLATNGALSLSLVTTLGLTVFAYRWSRHVWFTTPEALRGERVYFGTDTRAVELLIGASAALLWAARKTWSSRFRSPRSGVHLRGSQLVGIGALGALAWLARFVGDGHWLKFGGGMALAALLSTLVAVAVLDRPHGWLARGLSTPVLRWAGRRSYAIYLWHYVFVTWVRDDSGLVKLAAVGAALAMAEVSWRLVEHRRPRPSPTVIDLRDGRGRDGRDDRDAPGDERALAAQ